jgi:hypothetical protein
VVWTDTAILGSAASSLKFFPVHHREAFTELLKAANLHVDPVTGFSSPIHFGMRQSRHGLRFRPDPVRSSLRTSQCIHNPLDLAEPSR